MSIDVSSLPHIELGLEAQNANTSTTSSTYSPNPHICAICKEPESTPYSRLTNCGHRFHTQCIGSWINQQRNGSCPLCKCVVNASDKQLIREWASNGQAEEEISEDKQANVVVSYHTDHFSFGEDLGVSLSITYSDQQPTIYDVLYSVHQHLRIWHPQSKTLSRHHLQLCFRLKGSLTVITESAIDNYVKKPGWLTGRTFIITLTGL